MTDPTAAPTTEPVPDVDQQVLDTFRRLAAALRAAAVELRGPTAAPGSALHAAGQAVDDLADLMRDDITAAAPVPADLYDLDPEG
jgi:hypothetical protein